MVSTWSPVSVARYRQANFFSDFTLCCDLKSIAKI